MTNLLKKLSLLVMCSTAAAVVPAQASIGVFGDVNYWEFDAQGTFGEVEEGFESKRGLMGTVGVEHDMSYVPKAMVNVTSLNLENAVQKETADVVLAEGIAYYTLLNGGVNVDAGIGAKALQFSGSNTEKDYKDSAVTLPVAYGSVHVGIPSTPFSVKGVASYAQDSDVNIVDVKGELQVSFKERFGYDASTKLGYRMTNITDESVRKDSFEISGLYAGAELRF